MNVTRVPQRPTLDATARHGFAGDMLNLIEPETEADPAALLFQFLTAFGNAVGRNRWFQVEAARHYPNLFCCVVGKSSKARKGTSWTWVERLMAGAAGEWLPRLQKGLSSGEGLIHALRDADTDARDAGVTDKRLMVVESEFASVLQRMGREGNTLSANLREAWDGGTLQVMTRGQPQRATNAHLSLVTHITRPELQKLLSATERTNGLANRVLWVYADRSKMLPEGGQVEPSSLHSLSSRLERIIAHASTPGAIERSPKARQLWRDIYPELTAEPVGLDGEATSRGEAQVTRLSLVYALLDRADTIDVAHLEAAQAAWHYATQSAKLVFGDALPNALANRVRNLIEDRPRARAELFQALGGHVSKGRLDEALNELLEAGFVHRQVKGTSGRAGECWFPGQAREAREAKEVSPLEVAS